MGMEGFNDAPPADNTAEEPEVEKVEGQEEYEVLIKEIDQMDEKLQDALIVAYGSLEEANRYASMELTSRILNANPGSSRDMGMEKYLADKITYARNCLGVIREGNELKSTLEGNDPPAEKNIVKSRKMPALRNDLLSIENSAWRHLERK